MEVNDCVSVEVNERSAGNGRGRHVSTEKEEVNEERRGCVCSNRIVILCSDHPLFLSSYAVKEDR